MEVVAAQPCLAEPREFLTLYQCSLKQDKFEWVLQKGTELGVSRFVPVISERSIVRPAEVLLKKYKRWQAIVREASEQCRRGRIPEIAVPLTWDAAVAGAEGMRLLPSERRASYLFAAQRIATKIAINDTCITCNWTRGWRKQR